MAGIAFFLFAFLCLLVFAHYAVFASLSFLFGLSGFWQRAGVWILSALVPANFLFASFLIHSVENAVSRLWYVISAFSLGLVSNLFFLVLLGWGFVFGFRLIGAQPKLTAIGMAILAIGVSVSVYGVVNAFRPTVRSVEVTIPGLPDGWKGKTVVQISDVHLGPVYREEFLSGVVEKINALHPALVCIAGDLFDGTDGDLDALARPLRDIRSEHGTFFVSGNHETYLGLDRSLSALSGTGVRILDDQAVIVDGVAVIGIGYPERGAKKDIPTLAASLAKEHPGLPSILLYHAPSDIDRMRETGVGLQLSGHTHRGQQVPFNLVTHLVHKGYDYGLYEFGKYALSVSSGVGTWGPPLRIGTQSEIVAITLR